MTRALIIFYFISFSVIAQDSSKVFSYLDFYSIVIKNHPVVKQANLEIDYAQAELMQANGQYDPKLASNFERKSIGKTIYYNHWINELKVPVWGGIDFKIGNETNIGERLNPELSYKVTYSGINVPLGRGLLIDQRRNVLLQARIYQNIAKAEQQKLINKIVFSAAKEYWEWYLTFKNLQLQREGYELARNRFALTVERARIGEIAAVDSVEAKITVQDRQVGFQQAQVEFRNASLLLSNYLWNEAGLPLEIPENTIPATTPSRIIDENVLNNLLDQAKRNHPEITKLTFKLDQLKVEERFRKEMLKPQLDVSLNMMRSPKYSLIDYSLLQTNHKIGVNFEFPLFLRKERGKLQQVRVKQLQTDLERRNLSREILNDVQAAYNEAITYTNQMKVQQDAIRNQEILLRAEQNKFAIGESSLFLINSRESKLIEMKLKAESYKSKYEKALANLSFSAGLSE